MADTSYKTYTPEKLPISYALIDWEGITPILGAANRAISKYNGILSVLQNPSLLLSPMIREEAVRSSKIEGTQVDTLDVMKLEAGESFKNKSQERDFKEVINYRNAVRYGQEELTDRHLSLDFIKRLHSLLLADLSNERGGKCVRGSFRNSQNYIGNRHKGIQEARFVPPDPILVPELMENFADYIASDDKDPLFQSAIIHAQFEIIHPFEDGNGRLGRMLMPLFLSQKGVLAKPMFYISKYLEINSLEYKNALLEITHGSGWTQWLTFFLEGIRMQAEENFACAKKISDYYNDAKARLQRSTASQYAIPMLDAMIDYPIFRVSMLNMESKPSRNTMHKLLKEFEKIGIIKEITPGSGRSGAIYCMHELLNITEGQNVW